MAKKPQLEKDETKLVVTEGDCDLNTLAQLMGAHQYHFLPEKGNAKGESNVQNLIRGKIKPGTQVKYLAVIVDADTNPTARYRSYFDFFQSLGYEMPNSLPEGGFALYNPPEDKPKIAFWMMPNNLDPGCLEHFLLMCIEKESERWDSLEKTMSKNSFLNYQNDNHNAKSHAWTWLAWQPKPLNLSGIGFHEGAFNPKAEIAQTFVNWLATFFELSSKP